MPFEPWRRLRWAETHRPEADFFFFSFLNLPSSSASTLQTFWVFFPPPLILVFYDNESGFTLTGEQRVSVIVRCCVKMSYPQTKKCGRLLTITCFWINSDDITREILWFPVSGCLFFFSFFFLLLHSHISTCEFIRGRRRHINSGSRSGRQRVQSRPRPRFLWLPFHQARGKRGPCRRCAQGDNNDAVISAPRTAAAGRMIIGTDYA